MKANHAHGFLIMFIKDEREVVLEEAGEKFDTDMTESENEVAFGKMRNKLTPEDPKYLFFDFKFDTKEGRRDKLVFMNW